MKFKRFEEMPVWQDSRKLTGVVYAWTRTGKFSKDFGLRDQMHRSAISIMSNIAEGYERASQKEFLNFISYAKGSVGELRCQMYIALDLSYITEKEFKEGHELCIQISAQLTRFAQYIRANLKT